MNSLLLALALAGSSSAGTAPASVDPVRFEDLVRYSDLVVVGSVVRVEALDSHVARTDPGITGFVRLQGRVNFAELAVTRVLKGEPTLGRVFYLAASTWLCDITTAKLDERVLLFMTREDPGELFGPELRREIRERFAGCTEASILWSGRGRLPLERRAEGECATYWENDLLLPEDFPSLASLELKAGFRRSARLEEFERRIESLVKSQREAWVRASVLGPWDGSPDWDLEITWDRQARLVVHEPAGERVERFALNLSQTLDLVRALERDRVTPPAQLGSGTPRLGERTLELRAPAQPFSTRISWLDREAEPGEELPALRYTLTVWRELRDLFDEPACADHRDEDDHWLE
jgi:hypothetical protein